MGVMLQAHGRFDEALAAHDHALRIEPDHVLTHLDRGVTLQESGVRREPSPPLTKRADQSRFSLTPTTIAAGF